MKILLTGSTGFIGREINKVLKSNHDMITLGRKNCDIVTDLSVEEPKLKDSYDRVIHNAGLAHQFNTDSKEYESKMYETNFHGTTRLLNALTLSKKLPSEFIFISSVSVYGLQNGKLIDEKKQLLANDPYGKSKILAENAIIEWGIKHNVSTTILRLPLVIGENPPGNLGKMINGIRKYRYLSIGKAQAKKSMLLVYDLVNLLNREKIPAGVFNLTDGYNPSFKELERAIASKYGVLFILNLPLFFVTILAKIGDAFKALKLLNFPINTLTLNKITQDLTFSDKKAADILNWKPTKILDYYKNV
jgi:GlcNAc-P-P-Und epimerase